jgi:hypothetical protein
VIGLRPAALSTHRPPPVDQVPITRHDTESDPPRWVESPDMSPWSQVIGSTELVWHRANCEADLVAFLASGVRWVECDARLDPNGVVRVSHEPLDGTSDWMTLADGWERFKAQVDPPRLTSKKGVRSSRPR